MHHSSKTRVIEKTKTDYWDPVENSIKKKQTNYSTKELNKTLKNLKSHPLKRKKSFKILYFLATLSNFFVLFIILFLNLSSLLVFLSFILITPIAFFFTLTTLHYYRKTKQLEEKAIKQAIAKKHNWGFAPRQQTGKFIPLSKKFYQIFTRYHKRGFVTNEIWGSVNNKNFWMSEIFYFDRRNKLKDSFFNVIWLLKIIDIIIISFTLLRPTQENSVFAVPLRNKIKDILLIEVDTNFTFFGKKWKDVPAIEDFFKIKYYSPVNTKLEWKIEIIKKLSPFVQQKMIQLREDIGAFSLLFKEDCAIFIFPGTFIKKRKTNFFKNTDINQDDIIKIEKQIKDIVKIIESIGKYLK